jgi:adenine-specific DNA-methyltransferase
MTYQQINNLFKQRFNQTNWKQFLGEAFANSRLLATPEILTGIDSNVASQVQKLGYITLNENGIERQIAVYEVTLAQGIILERNRVGLRNLLRKYWKDIDAAFIAYHKPESGKWRFTYVSELTGYDADGEFVKIKTEPKRYTYVLGEGESTRTAAERFTAIASKGSKATLDDVKEAFSVEKLSKAFFDEYKKHYDIFCKFMVDSPNIRQTIFNGDEKGIRDFNKKLLGRIVFLYFIQKKGWLGVPSKSDWGKGDFDFLTNLFKNTKNPDLFYSELLSKLFFDTLNTKRKDDLIELVKGEPCRIPYLNGGLFEEDDKKHRNLIFPANLFKSLFDFFNQYNFTIYEDDPNDHTVAVDPEMLGHIFENLLEDNKDKGAYYTPKEIVHYMCQESIIEYLCTALQVEPEDQERIAVTNLLKKKEVDDILKFEIDNINTALDNVKVCDPAIGSGAFPMGLLHEIFTAKQTLHTFEHGNTKTFDASAVKLNIIQNSIYGVDIEKGAVDIARLRFWLSLIVDEEKPKALPNLDYKIVVGNSLVSKLGDEVIDIDWTIKEGEGFQSNIFGSGDLQADKAKILKKISQEQKEFFNPISDKKALAVDIRNLKIDLLITQLNLMVSTKGIVNEPTGSNLSIAKQTEIYLQTIGWKNSIKDLQKLKNKPELPLHFFDWKLDFPEVLNEQINSNSGFDIVIANPPYLKERDNAHIFNAVNNSRLGKSYHQGKMDFWYYFLHLAIDITSPKSVVAFITSRYWINSQGAKKLIDRVKTNLSFVSVVDIGKLKVFDNVAGHHMIHTYSKSKRATFNYKQISNDIKAIALEEDSEDIVVQELANIDVFTENEIIFASQDLKSKFKTVLGDKYDLGQGVVEASDKVSSKQFRKIGRDDVNVGDGVFVLSKAELKALDLNEEEKKLIGKYIDPNDVKSYKIEPKQVKYIIYSDRDNRLLIAKNRNYKNLKSHLDFYSDFITSSNGPYGLHRPREIDLFKKKKILFKGMFVKNECAIDEDKYFVGMSFISIIENKNSKEFSLDYLLGVLNSKYALNWFYTYGKKRGAGVDIGVDKLRTFPLAENPNKKIESLVKEIITKKELGKNTTPIEHQIDNLVYKLYELTYDEVKVIDPEFSLSKAAYEAIKLKA